MKIDILDRLWKTKDDLAEEYENNIDKLAIKLKVKESKTNYKIVDLSKNSNKK